VSLLFILYPQRNDSLNTSRRASAAGVEFLVGFESEFILLKSTKPVEASNYHSWTANNGFLSGSIESVILKEIANGIQASGIELQIYHPEAAPGQVFVGSALSLF